MLNRKQSLEKLSQTDQLDMLVIGGGATGLGIAVDAAQRGYSVALFEKNDFAKGTSSRSTKLIHGGVRYLAQGNIKLVVEALRERSYLLANAPHLTRVQQFVIPAYSEFDKWFYGLGLSMYDLLSGARSLGRTKILGKKSTLNRLPGIRRKRLRGGIAYADGQFDDARLVISLALTASDLGGIVLNYCPVEALLKENGRTIGVGIKDDISGTSMAVRAKMVVNASGVFADRILEMDAPGARPVVMPSQGVHLVISRELFASDDALMIPKTRDGRVLFAVPWQNAVVIGTTDTPLDNISEEPQALEEEIAFILDQFNSYREVPIQRKDVLSVFAGLRPLVKVDDAQNTAAVSREHTILVSDSGLLTIIGGKWTTYRKMAKDVVDRCIRLAGLTPVNCGTRNLKLYGYDPHVFYGDPLSAYGSEAAGIRSLIAEYPQLGQLIHPEHPFTAAEVIWSVRNEMAVQVEDVLDRRFRLLLVDARAALEAAPLVAALMAGELGRDRAWQEAQLESFGKLVQSRSAD